LRVVGTMTVDGGISPHAGLAPLSSFPVFVPVNTIVNVVGQLYVCVEIQDGVSRYELCSPACKCNRKSLLAILLILIPIALLYAN
jgi:hypothetical protein